MFIPSTSLLAIRATQITADNKSTAITITSWLLMFIFIIIFILRETIKFVVLRRFALDDLLILLAVIFAIGFSVTALTLASDGLGVFGRLPNQRANAIMKGYYASDFLYISSIGFVKLSLIMFFHTIFVQRTERRVVQGLGIFISAWTLASLLAVAFQCGLPRPWEILTLHCYNSGIFWIVYCIIDMTTEVCLIMLSVNLVACLKVKLSRKVVVVACFAPRILVIGAALARLIYLFPITPHDNPEFNLWVPVICTEVHICVSISTACIPYMKPFFEGAEARIWRDNDRRSKCSNFNTLCGYQSVPGYAKTHKQGKGLYSMHSTGSTSLKYGRTPDVSPRIPSPVPLSPMTPPRYSTPPNTRDSLPKSPSERGLRLHIPPPDIMIRRATDSTTPQTASSHALSPECLSPDNVLSPSRFSPGGSTLTPSPPLRSHSPVPLVSKPSSNSPDTNTNTNTMAPPRTPTFSLFPRTTSTQYSSVSPLTPKSPPSVPPLLKSRSRSNSQHRRISNPRMAANTSQRRSTLSQTSTLPLTLQAEKQKSTSPSIHTTIASPPMIPSCYLNSPPPSNPPNFPPPNPPNPSVGSNRLSSSPPSPQRLRNYRVLMPQNSHRKDQMSPITPASASPKTPLTFWHDDSSSGGEGLSAESGLESWKTERPWEREPMPIVRRVGMGSPRVVPGPSS